MSILLCTGCDSGGSVATAIYTFINQTEMSVTVSGSFSRGGAFSLQIPPGSYESASCSETFSYIEWISFVFEDGRYLEYKDRVNSPQGSPLFPKSYLIIGERLNPLNYNYFITDYHYNAAKQKE